MVEKHTPILFGERVICRCGDFNCASLDHKRFLFAFQKNAGKTVEFGPYPDMDEAKEAFQRRFGTWPSDALAVRNWS